MPLPGGAADKLGNKYEAAWTVGCLLEILRGRWDAIRIEPPGPEGDGVEFWLESGGQRTYYQVKRQNTSTKRWTLSALSGAGVLRAAKNKLEGSEATFVFASTTDAHELRNLAERACSASSWEEFEDSFLASKDSKQSFERLVEYWEDISETEAYELLRNVEIEVVDERTLRRHLDVLATVVCEGNATKICDSLAQIALEQIHQVIRSGDLWRALREREYEPKRWVESAQVLGVVDNLNRRYVRSLSRYAAGGHGIPRDEAQEVRDHVYGTENHLPRNVLVSGEAGVGKSFVMSQFIRAISDEGIPHLAFRLDRLESADDPRALGTQMGLPGSPVRVLAALAGDQPCVLLVDQLDAVSLTSGRSPKFFYCIEDLIDEARSFPKMRIVLACRDFDLENDYRFRQLIGPSGEAERVQVQRLSEEAVREAVAKYGLDAEALNDRQVKLLSVPLHLQLIAEIANEAEGGRLRYDFWTAKDLFDRYVQRKRLGLKERFGEALDWLPLFDTMIEYMSTRQVLSVPTDALEEHRGVFEPLVSEHILAEEGGRLAFFHEGFFDYVFAWRFAGRNLSLLELLLSDEQALFRRAQVRQILLHERESDTSRYLSDLRDILRSESVRFHIKDVVLSLLSRVSDPTKEEWKTVTPLLENGEPYVTSVRSFLWSASSWFPLLREMGLFKQWLIGEEMPDGFDAPFLVGVVMNAAQDHPIWAATILSALVPRACADAEDGKWQRAFRGVRWKVTHRGLFDTYLSLVRCEVVAPRQQDLLPDGLQYQMKEIRAEHPDWICEALEAGFAHRLRRMVAKSEREGRKLRWNGLDVQGTEGKFLRELAGVAPEAFTVATLPFVLAVAETFSDRDAAPPRGDRVWVLMDRNRDASRVVLSALIEALEKLRDHDLCLFEAAIGRLEAKANEYWTAQFVLVRLYTLLGERDVDRGLHWLTDSEVRFKTGYDNNAHWASREMLDALTPHASESLLRSVEQSILQYYPDVERRSITDSRRSGTARVDRVTRWGYAQYVLLGGIAEERLSPTAHRRLREWRRKFGPITPPKGMQGPSAVGPPRSVSKGDPSRMIDENWIKATQAYEEERKTEFADGGAYGGGRQLATVLKGEAARDPSRFARLAEHMPDDVPVCYFDAILRGLAEGEPSSGDALRLIGRCHELPGRSCGRFIVYLIQKKADLLPVGDERVADLVSWYAVNDDDPEQELWRVRANGGQPYHRGEPYAHGINCVRGSAAEAIGNLLFQSEEWFPLLRPALEQAVRDPSTAVRSCAAHALVVLLNYDRSLAVELFAALCNHHDDALLGTRFVERFLYYAAEQHWKELASILERAMRSEREEVRQVAARQITLGNLARSEGDALASECATGDAALRTGAAEIYAANLRQAQFKEKCESALCTFLGDESEDVRTAASKCFDGFEGDELGEYSALAEAFAQSLAFEDRPQRLLSALSETTAALPEAGCLAVERLADLFSLGDIGRVQGTGLATREAVRLTVRTYAQAESAHNASALKRRCLDIVDQLVALRAHGIGEALGTFER